MRMPTLGKVMSFGDKENYKRMAIHMLGVLQYEIECIYHTDLSKVSLHQLADWRAWQFAAKGLLLILEGNTLNAVSTAFDIATLLHAKNYK